MGKFKDIFNHFGQEDQIEKLREEVEEFIDAIRTGNREYITEEYADVCTLLKQFKAVYEIDEHLVLDIIFKKVDRTLDRIESGYYQKGLK